MKLRQGFVSNSSSSSFIVPRDRLSDYQLSALRDKCLTSFGKYQDTWNITEDYETIRGFTCMNNGYDVGDGGLLDWLMANNFPLDAFKWERD